MHGIIALALGFTVVSANSDPFKGMKVYRLTLEKSEVVALDLGYTFLGIDLPKNSIAWKEIKAIKNPKKKEIYSRMGEDPGGALERPGRINGARFSHPDLGLSFEWTKIEEEVAAFLGAARFSRENHVGATPKELRPFVLGTVFFPERNRKRSPLPPDTSRLEVLAIRGPFGERSEAVLSGIVHHTVVSQLEGWGRAVRWKETKAEKAKRIKVPDPRRVRLGKLSCLATKGSISVRGTRLGAGRMTFECEGHGFLRDGRLVVLLSKTFGASSEIAAKRRAFDRLRKGMQLAP